MPTRSITFHVRNQLPVPLSLGPRNLLQGQWNHSQPPRDPILPGEQATFVAEADGFMTGTVGEIAYRIDGYGSISLGWSVPFSGTNEYDDSHVDTGNSFTLHAQPYPSRDDHDVVWNVSVAPG